jgi:TolB-like protein
MLVAAASPSTRLLAGDSASRLKVAVIPFANFTGSNEAVDSLLPLIDGQLAARNIELVPRDSLRNIMRARRIRMTGAIDAGSALQLRETLRVDLLLTGSIDFYSTLENPEIGLSLRLFDCHQQRLVWTSSIAASGEDYAGLFGIGRVISTSVLSRRIVNRIFAQFPLGENVSMSGPPQPADIDRTNSALKAGARIAIVTFDNLTDQQRAGDIASVLLMSELWRQGYQVVEPGDVAATLAELRALPRGEISAEEIAQLREKLQVDVIVTGTIYRFVLGRGTNSESPPQIEMDMRLINATDGKVLASVSSARRGDDSEGIFGLRRCYSLGKLTQRSLANAWQQLCKQSEKRLTAVTRSGVDGEQSSASR